MTYSSVENTVYRLFLGILDCLVRGLCYIYYSWLSMLRKPKRDDNRGDETKSLLSTNLSDSSTKTTIQTIYSPKSQLFLPIYKQLLPSTSFSPSFFPPRPSAKVSRTTLVSTYHTYTHTHLTPTTTKTCRTSRRYRRPSTREIQ